MQGVQLVKEIIENKLVTKLSNGIYIVRLTGRDGNTYTQKLLVQ